MSSRQIGMPLSAPTDAAPGTDPTSAIAVSTLTSTARDILEGAFPPVWVRGEVLGFKAHRNGHWYFALRDRMAQVRAVVWSKDTRAIPAAPDDGMLVTAFGNLSVYPQKGEMQFVVRRMEAEGDGLWRKAFDRTKARLEADGLLAVERKRRLPLFPKCVAVVTSPDGAALRDIVVVIRRRAPGVRVVVVPAAVQGDTAVQDLCAALDRLGRWGGADVAIVGRGGGSREDLQAFNDERVARAVVACTVPVISAVGHETDVTICDMVADLRAPTPSAAAEAVVRDHAELATHLQALGRRLSRAVSQRSDRAKSDLQWHASALRNRSRALVRQKGSRLAELGGRLNALSPLATLQRGYAVAKGADGRTLSSTGAFTPDMPFTLALRDGEVAARVARSGRTP